MRALVIDRYGGPAVMRIVERPRPEPGPGELLVRVHAASVNPVDLKIREGKLKLMVRDRFPLTLGSDLSGEVVAVGAEVRGFAVGQAVFARLDKARIGAFAEYALVGQAVAAGKPPRLTHVQAASVPLVGLTAWQALVEIAALRAGQRVLIHAGSGGVGTLAIQLAKHLGAFVVTTASGRNHALLTQLGADQVIDHRTTRFETVVKDLDVVFDTQGGETLERSFAVVREGGVVVTIGGMPDAKFARAYGLNPLLVLALRFMTRRVTRLARRRGARFEYLFMRADGPQLAQLGELLDREVIRPVVDRTFSFDEVAEAFAYVGAGHAVGKVVVAMSPPAA